MVKSFYDKKVEEKDEIPYREAVKFDTIVASILK